jgi:clan AA aspartic protease (TIGR02281 family)
MKKYLLSVVMMAMFIMPAAASTDGEWYAYRPKNADEFNQFYAGLIRNLTKQGVQPENRRFPNNYCALQMVTVGDHYSLLVEEITSLKDGSKVREVCYHPFSDKLRRRCWKSTGKIYDEVDDGTQWNPEVTLTNYFPADTPKSQPQSRTADIAPVPLSAASIGNSVPIDIDESGAAWVMVDLGSSVSKMEVDTGASDVSIPKSLAEGLLHQGVASLADPVNIQGYDGKITAMTQILIKEIKVGNHVVNNVSADVVPDGATPLLGRSVLNQAGSITIDTKNKKLIFN